MAEWWLINEQVQDAIASHVDSAAESVVRRFDNHGNENSLTAALGQELMRQSLRLPDTEVQFDYRNFLEQDEEPATGADGGIIVTVRTPEETVRKGVLFQGKRLAQRRPVRQLTMSRDEASRLGRQIEDMLAITEDSVVVAHTRADIYVVDAQSLDILPIDELRAFPNEQRLVRIGTYLGKWMPRCTKGDLNPGLVQRIESPRGFLNHLFTVDVQTSQPPLLTEGGIHIDPLTYTHPIPKHLWRAT